jgi:2-amino-4-hydroxy-6-hydroxymethyldihydropteridine diphosphokinase
MREPVTAYIGIGANLGDAAATVKHAAAQLARLPQSTLQRTSALYRTAPHEAAGGDFINAVASVRTSLGPIELLAYLQQIELHAGRQRPYRNAPRTLDLDLLLYGNGFIDSARLQVPHPRMHERAFVLVPLAEIAPHLVDAHTLSAVRAQRVEKLPNE